ncbi:MAG TPA: metallophosphoesterase [Streptosporangiales bacterium]
MTLRLGVLTDLHVAEPGTPDDTWINTKRLGRSAELLARAVDALGDAGVDAVVLLGDLTENGAVAESGLVRRQLAAVGVPVFAVAGNHDVGGATDPVEVAGARRPGPEGTDAAGFTLAAGTLERDGGQAYREGRTPAPGGDRPYLWLSHFPVLDLAPALRQRRLPHPGDLANRSTVERFLTAHDGPVVVLSGHLHVHASVAAGPVLQLQHASLVERPHAYTVVDLSVDQISAVVEVVRRTETFEDTAPVDPFLCARQERWLWDDGTWQPQGS